jgi:dCMP deaminase
VLVGKNSGEDPQEMGFPPNVENPWTKWRESFPTVPKPEQADIFIDKIRALLGDTHLTLDAMIVWAGQHGSANSRIPMIGSDWEQMPGHDSNDLITGGVGRALATPQYAFVHYVSWLLDFISRWRESAPGGPLRNEEIWLCPDPRNYLKCREMRWPLQYPILAQYNFERYHKSERYGRFPDTLSKIEPNGYRENSLWVSNLPYCYSGLELSAVGAPKDVKFDPRPGPNPFGMVVNENLTGVKDSRLQILQDWIFPNIEGAIIRGHWTEKSQIEIGRAIDPVPYSEVMGVMKSFATTLTTPASGSGWATAKPWEAFALGSICFFHPGYDDQFHILPSKDGTQGRYARDERAKMLADFLRVENAQELCEKIQRVHEQPELYHVIVTEQRRHYERAFDEWCGGTLAVTERLLSDLSQGGTLDQPWAMSPWTQVTERPAAKLKMETRKEPRPRGTNEERKHKAPISRRKRIRQDVFEAAQTPVDVATLDETETILEPVVEASTPDSVETTTYTPSAALQSFTPPTLTIPSFWGLKPLQVKAVQPARPSKDEYFMAIAEAAAKMATCPRRQVGSVAVGKHGKILATGYNGVPRGVPHCNEGHPCGGQDYKSGEGLEACLANHSEINCLIQCSDVDAIETVYVTTAPCKRCVIAIMNTGAKRIVFRDTYPQAEDSKQLWLSVEGHVWVQL